MKKIVALLATLALSAVMLTGCGNADLSWSNSTCFSNPPPQGPVANYSFFIVNPTSEPMVVHDVTLVPADATAPGTGPYSWEGLTIPAGEAYATWIYDIEKKITEDVSVAVQTYPEGHFDQVDWNYVQLARPAGC